jgi:CheY-like chemotaxis protein
VDDNTDGADALYEGLRQLGYRVRVAYDAAAALEAAASFIPEAALVDIGLPVMDGYELAERIRRRPGLQGTRIVAVSGYSQDADRLRSARAGFVAHLVKPVRLEQVHQILQGEVEPGR